MLNAGYNQTVWREKQVREVDSEEDRNSNKESRAKKISLKRKNQLLEIQSTMLLVSKEPNRV